MTRYAITTGSLQLEAIANDDLEALEKAVDAGVLQDGDEGGIEELENLEPDGWEPEGPG